MHRYGDIKVIGWEGDNFWQALEKGWNGDELTDEWTNGYTGTPVIE